MATAASSSYSESKREESHKRKREGLKMKIRLSDWVLSNRGGAIFSSMAGLLGVRSSILLSCLIQRERQGDIETDRERDRGIEGEKERKQRDEKSPLILL